MGMKGVTSNNSCIWCKLALNTFLQKSLNEIDWSLYLKSLSFGDVVLLVVIVLQFLDWHSTFAL